MITLPFQVNSHEFEIFIGLEADNIERLTKYDPAKIEVNKYPKPFCDLELSKVTVGFVNEADKGKIAGMQSLGEVLDYLHRGWAFKPELGDNDEKYKRLET